MKYFLLIVLQFISSVFIAADNLPVIAVKGRAKVDFGTYLAKEKKETIFNIINTGKRSLEIGKIRKTCGCAESKIDKNIIKPGEIGKLKVVVLADSIYGGYSKNIYVESNDPKKRFLTLTVAGKAIPLITVKPRKNIYAGQLAAGKEWKQEFLLEGTTSKIELAEPVIECPVPATVKLTKTKDGQFRLIASLTPEKGVGVFKCKVKVPIIKPTGWKSPVIMISGKVK